LNYLHTLAECLHAPQDILTSDIASFLNNYINEELERRLGTSKALHVKAKLFKKEPFFDPQVYAVKKSSRHRIPKSKKKKSKNKSKSKKKKSKSSRVHIARVDEQSDSNSSESDTSTSSESEDSSSSSSSSSFESNADINVNITKSKKK